MNRCEDPCALRRMGVLLTHVGQPFSVEPSAMQGTDQEPVEAAGVLAQRRRASRGERPSTLQRATLCATLRTMLLLAAMSAAFGADYEREVRDGITSFKRFTDGDRPQNVYAVRVDLSVPNIGLHASADRRGDEWYTDTLSFAEEVGAVAAINGDWSCTTCSGDDYLAPLGLAISGGAVWNDHIQTDAIGNYWGYLACTFDKRCDLGRAAPLGDASMVFSPLQTPSVYPLRYANAIGANGSVLIDDGVAGSGCYDTSTTNPRSAACIEADGTHLWLAVVDGRGAGGGTGMSCDEVRELLLGAPFLCWDAVMLDGGGSSTLVVEDTNTSATCNPRGDDDLCVKNNPSDGAPRTVANHLAITWEDDPDTRCVLANGRWCEGTAIHACEGGRYGGSGDCAAYGATCQEDADFAFCVDPRCPEGDGLRNYACLDATQIASCNDGQYGVGDCAGFGLVCGSDDAGAACMDARCSAGPHSSFCLSETSLAACTDGVYVESTCPPEAPCADGACRFPNDDTGNDTGNDTGDTADSSSTPEDSAAATPSELPGRLVLLDAAGCSLGCATSPGGAGGLAAIAAFGLIILPYRRQSPRLP